MTWYRMARSGTACPGPQGTWWRCQAELAQERDSPMQKQGRQPAGLAALRWKVPAAQESQSRPRTLGWGHRAGRGQRGNGGDWVQRVGWGLGSLVGLGTPGTRLGLVRLSVMGDWSGSCWGAGLGAMGQGVGSVLGGLDWVPPGITLGAMGGGTWSFGGQDWLPQGL